MQGTKRPRQSPLNAHTQSQRRGDCVGFVCGPIQKATEQTPRNFQSVHACLF